MDKPVIILNYEAERKYVVYKNIMRATNILFVFYLNVTSAIYTRKDKQLSRYVKFVNSATWVGFKIFWEQHKLIAIKYDIRYSSSLPCFTVV